jgi:short-subunit dehydrogenase
LYDRFKNDKEGTIVNILVTGNKKWGLVKSIHRCLNEEYDVNCVSRDTYGDLNTQEIRDTLKGKSLSFDVFINCAKLSDFNQTLLLKDIWDCWIENEKKGHIINIGSTVDTGLKGGSRLYTVEKVALRNLSRKLTYDSSSGNGIKVTYISLGYLDMESVSFKDKVKIELHHVVDVIEWVLEAPDYLNVNEISIDPIQEKMK